MVPTVEMIYYKDVVHESSLRRGTISLGFPGRQWHIASSSGIANGAIYGGFLLAKQAGEKR